MTGIAKLFRLFDVRFLVCLSSIYCFQPVIAGDAIELQALAAPCLACHSVEPDGATRVGPSLADIDGRAVGSDSEYVYSEAFSSAAGKGLIWTRATLDQFLENPAAMIEGTLMNFPGVADPDHRNLLLDWLLTDDPGAVVNLADANYSRHPDVAQVLATPPDVEYGEYLAGECQTCHQQGDSSGGVPPIYGLTPDYFVHALLEYQRGVRGNQVMQNIVSALGLEEISALASTFTQ